VANGAILIGFFVKFYVDSYMKSDRKMKWACEKSSKYQIKWIIYYF
jgi:hypothetical protein